jgi:hypothetical protein
MTRDQAKKFAEAAFDEMGNHPEIWLTHGYPSDSKAYLIMGIIAEAIVKSHETAKAADGWRDIAGKLARMAGSFGWEPKTPMPLPPRIGDRVALIASGRQGKIVNIVSGKFLVDIGHGGMVVWPHEVERL